MAKKIVRGITDVKTINNQDYDTNNVNDLLSDGEYSYIHRKKGKSEEYHNLTDNIKTISSDNTDLLAVTNNNKTTNSATLHPKHDAQKEQVLESTRNTVNIHHGANGTDEKTTVDTNPQKVLEHDNLIASTYLTKKSSGNTTTLKVSDDFVSIVNGKQNTIQGSMSVGITNGNWLRQCFYYRKVYNVSGGVLKTHVKSIAPNTNVEINHDEYNFSLQINQGASTLTFTLEEVDLPRFQKVLGSSNTANISGCVFTLSGSTLTVSTSNNTEKNYIMTYSDILD